MTPEGRVQSHAVRRARAQGVRCYKFSAESRRSVPDYLFLHNAQAWFVEFKAPGKRPTKAQLREHRILQAAGFVVDVIDDTAVFTRRLTEFLHGLHAL